MKNWSFIKKILSKKDLGENVINHLYLHKNQSSKKKNHFLCFVESDSILQSFTKQGDDKFKRRRTNYAN